MKNALLFTILIAFGLNLKGQIIPWTIPWPLFPQNTDHDVIAGYGGYEGVDIHFHSGVDMAIDAGEPVYSVSEGRIVWVLSSLPIPYILHPYFESIFVATDQYQDSLAWGYAHLEIWNHPIFAREWQVNDYVLSGGILGHIAPHPGVIPHLHFS